MKRKFTEEKGEIVRKLLPVSIALILSIFICVFFAVWIYRPYATEKEFKPLKEQLYQIEKNPEIIWNFKNATIGISENLTTVIIYDENCHDISVTAELDKNKKIISMQEEDSMRPFWVKVLGIIGIGMVLSYMLSIAFIGFSNWISKKRKKN